MTTERPTAGVYQVSDWRSLRVLARAMMLTFLRDRTALFFTFFFPLMFLVVFGLLFGNPSSTKTTVAVVGQGPLIQQLPASVLTLKSYSTFDQAIAAVKAGDVPAAITQEGDRLLIRYAASDAVQAATVRGVVSAVVDRANVADIGQTPRSRVDEAQVEDESLAPIQFTTGGILSWGVATSAVFGAALTIVSWRKKQLLRRIRLSPAPVWTIVGARVGVSLVVSFAQAAVYIGVALTPPFGLKLAATSWLIVPLLFCGTLAFLSIGLLVGSIAKTEEAGSAMANFIVLPMAFLSGSFFNLSGAPGWLQSVSQVLPLRHLNDGMVDVLGRSQGLSSILIPCAILLGFAAIMTALATRFFQWDDV
jgi:ABC-2 type transport system permease protein